MIRLKKGTEITPEIIDQLIRKHQPYRRRQIRLQKQYEGDHEIKRRAKKDKEQPCNKLVTNHCRYITNVATGYFMGTPVAYSCDNKEYLAAYKECLDDNFAEDIDAENAKQASIKGESYELLWVNEKSQIKFKYIPVEETILIYGYEIEDYFWAAIRYYKAGDTETAVVYTDKNITTYTRTVAKGKKKGAFAPEGEPEPHPFGDVPIVQYKSNEELQGDFEQVISLNDAYNSTQSDTADDFDYFSDAYLLLIGLTADDAEIRKMREQRVLTLDENGKAEWLLKQSQDTSAENFKTRLKKDIHSIAQVPDLTDENFAGNLSGVAMRFKLWGLEQLTATKERKFRTGLLKRAELITNVINTKKATNYDYRQLKITFHRTIPENILEWAQIVQQLNGVISHKTALEKLPFIKDPEQELSQIEKERPKLDDDEYGDFFGGQQPPGEIDGQPQT